MGELSPWHLLIVAGAFVLLFGAKRLPEAARSVGKSMRIFKTELKGLRDDETPAPPVAQPPAELPAAPPAAPTPAPPASQATPAASDPTSPR